MSDQTDIILRRTMAAYVGISPDPPSLPHQQPRRHFQRPALVFAAAFITVVVIGVATVAVLNLGDTELAEGGTTQLPDPLSWTHLTFAHEQTLDLRCEGRQIFDQGGFDNITFDVWRDPDALLTRVQATYPDGSAYNLILEGPEGNWDRAWASGVDHGRQAGCTESFEDGSSSWTYAGEAWLDFGPGPSRRFLAPLEFDDDGVGVYVFVPDRETVPAIEVFERDPELRWYRYSLDSASRSPEDPTAATESVNTRTVWYGIDPETSELQRFERTDSSPLFDVSITAAVTATDTNTVGANVFDLTGYQPVWDTESPVVTTAPPPP